MFETGPSTFVRRRNVNDTNEMQCLPEYIYIYMQAGLKVITSASLDGICITQQHHVPISLQNVAWKHMFI